MILAAAIFLVFAPQQPFDEIVDSRSLPMRHTGHLRTISSDTAKQAHLLSEADGTFPIVKSTGHNGSLARLWMSRAHPRARLRLYLDKLTVPVFSERIGPAFEEGHAPLNGSFTFFPTNAAGSYVTYTPFHYRHALQLTVSTPLDAFEAEWIEDESLDLKMLNPDPAPVRDEIPKMTVEPGASAVFALDDHAGTVMNIAFAPEDLAQFDLTKTRLRIYVDGETDPGIDASFASIFARPARTVTFNGAAIEVTEKRMTLNLPIPHQKECKVEIFNGSDKPVSLHGTATTDRDPVLNSTRRLMIREWKDSGTPGAPVVVGDFDAPGHFIGMTVNAASRPASELVSFTVSADGQPVYHSVSLASAFDAGDDFLKAAHTTFGAGVSHVGTTEWSGYVFRLSRPVIFEKSAAISFECRGGQSLQATGAIFAYIDRSKARSESRPADAQSNK
ncbi:MAG: DUF2961 domain-containing protein [Planctomycetes bacterium]|nr:DUF2961 domain-containing protein [Planctomycetota bacterium]